MWLMQGQLFLNFLATSPEFQFMATVFVSMAARLSNLDDQKPGVNNQTEGHTLTPPSGWNGSEDQEAFGSAPSHSPPSLWHRNLQLTGLRLNIV